MCDVSGSFCPVSCIVGTAEGCRGENTHKTIPCVGKHPAKPTPGDARWPLPSQGSCGPGSGARHLCPSPRPTSRSYTFLSRLYHFWEACLLQLQIQGLSDKCLKLFPSLALVFNFGQLGYRLMGWAAVEIQKCCGDDQDGPTQYIDYKHSSNGAFSTEMESTLLFLSNKNPGLPFTG